MRSGDLNNREVSVKVTNGTERIEFPSVEKTRTLK